MSEAITTERTPQDVAYGSLIRALKAAVKNDRSAILAKRAEMRTAYEERDPHVGAKQSQLSNLRHGARARHLAYGLSRGHSWERMERNRPEGDEKIAYAIRRAFQEAAKVALEETGIWPVPNEVFSKFVPGAEKLAAPAAAPVRAAWAARVVRS